MVVFFGLFFGYKKFYDNPNTVVKFSSYGDKGKETKEVEKVAKKSEYKNLPYAEEVIKHISENKDKEENKHKEYYDLVREEYGEDIMKLSIAGFLPSSLLSEQDNKLLLLNGNALHSINNEKQPNFFPPTHSLNTEDYIYSLGESKPSLKETQIFNRYPYSLDGDDLFTNNTFFSTSDSIGIQGLSLGDFPNTDEGWDFFGRFLTTDGFNIESIDTEEKAMEIRKDYKLLNVNIITTKETTFNEINKEINKIKLNDTEITQIVNKEDVLLVPENDLNFNTLKNGNDFVVTEGSVFQTIFIINKDVPLYSETNYVTFGKDKIELRKNNGSSFSQINMYKNIKL